MALFNLVAVIRIFLGLKCLHVSLDLKGIRLLQVMTPFGKGGKNKRAPDKETALHSQFQFSGLSMAFYNHAFMKALPSCCL